MNCNYCGEPSMVWSGVQGKFIQFIPAKDAKSFMCGFCVATGRLRSEHELPEPEDFQKDLKAWRKQKGMTQIQLADHLMVKQPLIVEVEKGRKVMPGRWVKILQNIT